MDEFDFLSRIPLGLYVPTNSILHRLNPLAKIVMLGALLIAVTFTPSRIGLAIGVVVILVALLISKVKLGFALKALVTPLPFLLVIAIIQVILFSSVHDPNIIFRIGRIYITATGLWAGILLLVRFSALILLLSLGGFMISTSELLQGLTHLLSPLNHIGIQTMDFIAVVQVTLRFLPFLAQSAERIAKAQASRGGDWGGKRSGLINRVRQIIPLIIPLFITSLRRSENLALAMDARAYGLLNDRTSMNEIHFTWSNWLVIVLSIMVSLAIFLV